MPLDLYHFYFFNISMGFMYTLMMFATPLSHKNE